MAIKIYISGGAINIDNLYTDKVLINPINAIWGAITNKYYLRDGVNNMTHSLGVFSNIEDEDGNVYNNDAEVVFMLNKLIQGNVNTSRVDRTTPIVVAQFNKITNSTTITAQGERDDDTITVADATGAIPRIGDVNGSYLVIFSPTTGNFHLCQIVSINGLILTLDTQLGAVFPTGSNVDITITNLAVDGSATRQVYGVRGQNVPARLNLSVNITRILITALTPTAVNLAKFGDLPKLLRGLILRKRLSNGNYEPIFNIKANIGFEGITLDWKPYTADPPQGQNGFSVRLTFGGEDKLGAIPKLSPGEDLELVVQDELQTITEIVAIAEGNILLT